MNNSFKRLFYNIFIFSGVFDYETLESPPPVPGW